MIRFHQVAKSFGSRRILNHISLEIRQGEILFILGTSGTGKSVLLKLLVGLLNADHGEIWFHDENIAPYTEEQFLSIRRRIGMVFQQPALFDSLTVFENIAFGLRRLSKQTEVEIQQTVTQCLRQVHLTELEQRLPHSLSYGQQKRVSMARTLALKPEVLLFDEPTTGLDPVSTHNINMLIQELARSLNTTSVVVSHDMKCALEIADRILVLDKGQVVAGGNPQELKESSHPLVRSFLQEVV